MGNPLNRRAISQIEQGTHFKVKSFKSTWPKINELIQRTYDAVPAAEGEAGAEIITVAENNIKEREEKEQSQKGALAGILSTINIDPKLVAAAEAKAKKGRKTTEDKKASAGVLQRSKPGTEARTQH